MPQTSPFVSVIAMQSLSHKRPANLDRFWFGAAYYPEHWDAATRESDADRIAAAGFNLLTKLPRSGVAVVKKGASNTKLAK